MSPPGSLAPPQDLLRPKVMLWSLACPNNPTLARMKGIGEQFLPRNFVLVRSLEDADIVLCVENGYVGLQQILDNIGTIAQRKPLFVFSECDWPFPFLPGLYCSLAKNRRWARSWSFLLGETPPPDLGFDGDDYLFSFIGRVKTHPCRAQIRMLDSAVTPCLDVNEAPQRFAGWRYESTYHDIMRKSRFVLCPRGIGASSMRIFEAMRAGRPPIIISDDWIAPPVGDWSLFSFRIAESEIETVPALCRQNEDKADEMGSKARAAYERYFSPEVFIDRALQTCLDCFSTEPVGMGRTMQRIAQSTSTRELRTLAHDVLERVHPFPVRKI